MNFISENYRLSNILSTFQEIRTALTGFFRAFASNYKLLQSFNFNLTSNF